MRRAAAIVGGVTLLACGCGSSQNGPAGHTTVQHYSVFPADTISVSAKSPGSAACRRDAAGFARGAAGFVSHYGAQAVSPADVYYVLMREELADFEARRCDPKLLGSAIERRLSPAARRVLVANASPAEAAALRRALRR